MTESAVSKHKDLQQTVMPKVKIAYETNPYFHEPKSGVMELEFEWPFSQVPFEEANDAQIRLAAREMATREFGDDITDPLTSVVILDGDLLDKMKQNFEEK